MAQPHRRRTQEKWENQGQHRSQKTKCRHGHLRISTTIYGQRT